MLNLVVIKAFISVHFVWTQHVLKNTSALRAVVALVIVEQRTTDTSAQMMMMMMRAAGTPCGQQILTIGSVVDVSATNTMVTT